MKIFDPNAVFNPPEISSLVVRKQMPADVFVKIWREGITALQEIGAQWTGLLKVRASSTMGVFIEFYRIEVEEMILPTSHDKPYHHLILSDCQISNCIFNNIQFQSIFIHNSSITGDFVISNSRQTGVFEINNSNVGHIKVQNSKTGKFEIHQATTGSFEISSSTTGGFRIDNSTSGDFWFRENSSIGSFRIFNSKALRLTVSESRVHEIQLWHSKFQRIRVHYKSYIGYLRGLFNLQTPTQLLFERSDFVHIDLTNSVFPEFNTLTILNCTINQLSINNFCNYGTIFIGNLKPLKNWDDFVLEKIDQDDVPVIKNGQHQTRKISNHLSILRLTDSDLGKVQFINCDLMQFQRFEFSNTKMLEVFVAGSQMPEDENFLLPGEEEELKKPLSIKERNDLKRRKAEQKRLAYGQFKKIYEARGDVAGSLPYLAYEMNAYLDELNLKSKSWRDHFGERWMLRLNRYSTNYGNDWLLGAKRVFGTMVICYLLFCLSLGYVPGSDVAKFIDVASYAPQYLNPFRDADSVIPDKILPPVSVWWAKWVLPFSRIIDYLSRIVVAYFVYQTIQAFRKLGKSSG